jgi:hypothetical protein
VDGRFLLILVIVRSDRKRATTQSQGYYSDEIASGFALATPPKKGEAMTERNLEV